ncbi:hypothetical protein Vretimale_6502 [Volvox reticuliferus]|uniref:Uncharacterized protein n=1 Tax=Volvox reticuliferus TaxID=1737510 RepID=A0A8J4G7K2_9CHLO|nr:hypothetical protein Vretifemale_20009 [Volvox reticuliferus]GIM01693.1 hypothetical protein Vretimale_6502 [Volvox reticuliferus]
MTEVQPDHSACCDTTRVPVSDIDTSNMSPATLLGTVAVLTSGGFLAYNIGTAFREIFFKHSETQSTSHATALTTSWRLCIEEPTSIARNSESFEASYIAALATGA